MPTTMNDLSTECDADSCSELGACYDVVVIGAGISGLWAAQQLRQQGASVLVLEKARGSGGRMSSKRLTVELDGEQHAVGVDLGCPSFEIKDQALRSRLEAQIAGLATITSAAGGQEYVGKSRNSAITRALLEGCEAWFSTRVTAISKATNGAWCLSLERNADDLPREVTAKHIVLSAPPEQAAALLPAEHRYKVALAGCKMRAQWVAVLVTKTLESDRLLAIREALASDELLASFSLENDKPTRSLPEGLQAWVLRFEAQWSHERMDWDKESLLECALQQFSKASHQAQVFGLQLLGSHVHRWLYSLPPLWSFGDDLCAFDQGIGICGDYWGAEHLSGVERALSSADALVQKFLQERTVQAQRAHQGAMSDATLGFQQEA